MSNLLQPFYQPTSLHNPQFDGQPFFLEGGPTGVLLSHGYTATCWEVRLLADKLHAHGYTVAGPLLPGHGSKPKDLNRVRGQDWAEAGEKVYQIGRESLDRSDIWQGYPGLPLKGAVQLLKFQQVVIQSLSKIHQPMLIFQGRMDTTVHPQAGEMILQG